MGAHMATQETIKDHPVQRNLFDSLMIWWGAVILGGAVAYGLVMASDGSSVLNIPPWLWYWAGAVFSVAGLVFVVLPAAVKRTAAIVGLIAGMFLLLSLLVCATTGLGTVMQGPVHPGSVVEALGAATTGVSRVIVMGALFVAPLLAGCTNIALYWSSTRPRAGGA